MICEAKRWFVAIRVRRDAMLCYTMVSRRPTESRGREWTAKAFDEQMVLCLHLYSYRELLSKSSDH